MTSPQSSPLTKYKEILGTYSLHPDSFIIFFYILIMMDEIYTLGPVSIYPKDVFEMVADRNAAPSLGESSQRRLLVIETHPW